jgi:hypothetical protein
MYTSTFLFLTWSGCVSRYTFAFKDGVVFTNRNIHNTSLRYDDITGHVIKKPTFEIYNWGQVDDMLCSNATSDNNRIVFHE